MLQKQWYTSTAFFIDMKFSTLHPSLPPISMIGLGTMSFGSVVDANTSQQIMDEAIAQGINFFDTAEMYSVPASAETCGATETIIGDWMQQRNNRNKIVLATKIVGGFRSGVSEWIRGGTSKANAEHIQLALEGSLKRLKTDSIDLYQIHWPDRLVNRFGERDFVYPNTLPEETSIEETLLALQKLQQAGKIKAIGISNETPWGTMEYLRLAKEKNLPKVITVQNNYSLITRSYESNGMAEISYREGINLLAYSPLGYGALVEHQRKNGRWDQYPSFVPRYQTPVIQHIVAEYKAIAHDAGMTVSELAILFAATRPFMGSVLIGPSVPAHVTESALCIYKTLSPQVEARINAVHAQYPNMCA